MIKIHLTDAQQSAIECRDWSEEPAMQAAWDGRRTLRFEAAQADQLSDELNEASNAEDAHAEIRRWQGDHESARRAASASRALTAVMLRVTRHIPRPPCGHSACRQHWIDTASAECVLQEVR